jgi:hypothetical protein
MFARHPRKLHGLVIWVILLCGVGFPTGCAAQRSAITGASSARKDVSSSQTRKADPPFRSYRHLGHTDFKRSSPTK